LLYEEWDLQKEISDKQWGRPQAAIEKLVKVKFP